MSRGVTAPVFGKCPTCGRVIALARVANDQGSVRNHMPPPALRDEAHADRYRSGVWSCRGGRTRVAR